LGIFSPGLLKTFNISFDFLQAFKVLKQTASNAYLSSFKFPLCALRSVPLDRHCCQIAENSAKKLKYSGRKKLFTVRNWSGTLAEMAEK
jgi:hypothetical protein